MWVARIKLTDDNCIWATRCKKFNIYNYQYPLGFYRVNKGLALVVYHVLEGDDRNVERYIKEVRKDKRIRKLDVKNNLMISLAVESRSKSELKAFEAFYNPKLIWIKPDINYPDGSEIMEVGSFDRKDLVTLLSFVKRHYQGELLSLKDVKVPRIFIPGIMPLLSEKQYSSFKIASMQGYYEYPRKTNLHKLASISNVSRPTFEEHLRKAEIKLLKFMKELILR